MDASTYFFPGTPFKRTGREAARVYILRLNKENVTCS